jgi:phosphatidylglycerophosphate synthase
MTESRSTHQKGGGPSPNVTVADVRASFNRKIKNHFTVSWFGRPLANLMTPPFYNAGWSANGVSYLRIVIAFGGVGLLLTGAPLLHVAAAAIFYLCFVLDCVDGNLARMRGTVTYWGKFLDGLSDFVFVLGAPIAAGVGLWLFAGRADLMLLGALVTATSLTSQMVRSRLSFTREWMTANSGPIDDATTARAGRARAIQGVVSAIYVNGTFFAPLLLLIPHDGAVWYVWCLVVVQLVPEVIWLMATIAEARVILDRSRRSIHAAPPTEEAS